MIAFDLECDNNHIFEGWFENAEAFETQNARNLISCPVCGSQMVNVKNETLYGWEVTLQRKCTVCPYSSGKHRKVPTLYIFNRR